MRTATVWPVSRAHFLLNPSPLSTAYLSMNRMNRFQSPSVFITYLASIPLGFPLINLALTSTVLISPSSSMRNMPVMSP